MPHPTFTTEEICSRGQALYETKLKPIVETESNIGKLISIDIETGDYEIADSLITTGDRLRARHPEVVMFGARIGYDAVYAVGTGAINRVL